MKESVRFLLKLSGEALTENGYKGLKRKPVNAVINQINSVWPQNQVAVLVGGGNIDRGSGYMRDLELDDEDAVDADWMGMAATHINGIALKILLSKAGITCDLMLAKPYGDIGEPFYKDKAISHLKHGHVIILVGGVGRPRFTTDTAAVLSALEIRADMVLKGTKVDGIYNGDPNHPETGASTTHIPYITYDDFLSHQPPLRIMDTAAVALARDSKMRIRVFNIFEPDSLARVLAGEGKYSEIGPPKQAS